MQIHVTTLSAFWQCPYKFKHDKSEILLEMTHRGDLGNIGATTMVKNKETRNKHKDALAEYYARHLQGDMKDKEIMKLIMDKINEYVEGLYKENELVIQEGKMFLPITQSQGDWIVGTPDIIIRNGNDIHIQDIKVGALSYYEGDNKWRNLQTIIYPLFIREREPELQTKPITFSYQIFCKKTGKRVEHTIKRQYKECKEITNKVIVDFYENILTQEYAPKKAECEKDICRMCPLKKEGKCPAWQGGQGRLQPGGKDDLF